MQVEILYSHAQVLTFIETPFYLHRNTANTLKIEIEMLQNPYTCPFSISQYPEGFLRDICPLRDNPL